MHDVPYVKSKDISSETTAMMTKVCVEIRKVIPESIACGIQILAGCNKEALAVAKAADFNFIRSEGYIFSHIADEGFIDGCSGNLLRYRKHIDAENILIFADIKKKHSSHAITSDISIAETVKAAEFFLADGVILTGSATGDPADLQELNGNCFLFFKLTLCTRMFFLLVISVILHDTFLERFNLPFLRRGNNVITICFFIMLQSIKTTPIQSSQVQRINVRLY
ncbi:PREDICTED: uncharacterized protein F13E9.13, mitochondrial isoform X3 [Polistes canadensis]|nr:PREDICTED: uncharacterized protein F13E9.13, mitochondrial isoform X3 [Polistes canadensis]